MPDQLTTARDQIAEMCGFHKHPNLGWCRDTKPVSDECPIPASLDFVSRVWPDEPYHTDVSNKIPDFYGIETHEARLEYWTTSLRDALQWLRDNDRPAFAAACEKIRKECGK